MRHPISPCSRRWNDGLALVDVLLALGLLTTAVVTAAGLFLLAGRQAHRGRELSRSVLVAERILGDLSAIGYERLPSHLPTCCGSGCDVARRCAVDLRVDPVAAATWAVGELPPGPARVVLTPLGGVEPSTFGMAEGIRLRVEVGEPPVVLETVCF